MIRLIGHRRSLEDFFLKRRLLRSGSRVLDGGCGTGALTLAMRAVSRKEGLEGIRWRGFDVTERMLDRFRASAAFAKEFELVRADVLELPEALPPDWRDFDLIASAGMLEYLPKQTLPAALGNLRALLGPDGRLALFISRDRALGRLFVGMLWKANVYSKDELIKAFDQAGFSVRLIEPFHRWGYAVVASRR